VVAIAVGGSYAAYQRVGTTANVATIEHTPNLGGGCAVLGLSDEQPGFLLLSELDWAVLDVSAEQMVNWATGTHTRLVVTSPSDQRRIRLRGPVLILAHQDGSLADWPLDWSLEEFRRIRNGMDCEKNGTLTCGAVFADLARALARWPQDRVPQPAHRFLALHVKPQDLHKH